MQQLGIKRSRLTQISGRELRVGRVRRGRYVSPVYRPGDVVQYLEWTRATATHMKASSVLQDAAAQLEDSSERLAERVERAAGTVADVVHEVVARSTSRVIARVDDELAALARVHEAERARLEGLLLEVVGQLSRVRQRSSQQASLIETLATAVTQLAGELREAAALVRVLREDQQLARAAAVEQLAAARGEILERLDDGQSAARPTLSKLKRLSREKLRARQVSAAGTGPAARTSGSAGARTDRKRNPARVAAPAAAAGRGPKRRPSRLQS
jgi:hypothetical protein